MKKVVIFLVAVIVIGVITLIAYNSINNMLAPNSPAAHKFKNIQSSSINPDTLPGINTSNAPWDPEIMHLKERLSKIGLPALSAEGTVMHIHEHLDIYIRGKHIVIPAGIGIDEGDGFISPVHTHDTSGIIHVESPVKRNFTLGQFFDIWGVRFTNSCIGGYCNGKGKNLSLFSNGKKISSNFRDLILTPHQEIVIVYGTANESPSKVASSYNFPLGY